MKRRAQDDLLHYFLKTWPELRRSLKHEPYKCVPDRSRCGKQTDEFVRYAGISTTKCRGSARNAGRTRSDHVIVLTNIFSASTGSAFVSLLKTGKHTLPSSLSFSLHFHPILSKTLPRTQFQRLVPKSRHICFPRSQSLSQVQH